MALSAKGKVHKVLAIETGQSNKGPWEKQTFIIETLGEYPKKIAFDVFGKEKTAMVSHLKIGVNVTVHFNLESRDYKENYYTTVKAWKIDIN